MPLLDSESEPDQEQPLDMPLQLQELGLEQHLAMRSTLRHYRLMYGIGMIPK